jgi:hypothetical protein
MVTGSRHWKDRQAIVGAFCEHVGGGQHTLIHGKCEGLDILAEAEAKALGWAIEPHEVSKAEWRRLGGKAGPLRNQRMVDSEPDILLAFPLPGSRGTWDAVKRAHKAGIWVVIVAANSY